jgi:hypothetical protein
MRRPQALLCRRHLPAEAVRLRRPVSQRAPCGGSSPDRTGNVWAAIIGSFQMQFAGKVVLVTGAQQGIEIMALRLSQSLASVDALELGFHQKQDGRFRSCRLTRANPGVLDLQRPRPRERQTRWWRKRDSNRRSLSGNVADPNRWRGKRQSGVRNGVSSTAGPMVRIRFPPALSHERTGPAAEDRWHRLVRRAHSRIASADVDGKPARAP